MTRQKPVRRAPRAAKEAQADALASQAPEPQAPEPVVVDGHPTDDVLAAQIRAQALRQGNRRALTERQARLEYPKRPGWTRVWMNDTPGNIDKQRARGWDFVIDPATKQNVHRAVGVAEGGGALLGYLMEIPTTIYDEDRANLASENDAIDAQIRRGEADGKLAETELRVPTNDDGSSRIKITNPR